MKKQRNKLLPILLILLTTVIVGLMNTVFIRPEDLGTWKNCVGYAFLLIALGNLLILVLKLRSFAKRRGTN